MGRTAKYHEKDFSTLKEEFVGRDELIDDFKKYYSDFKDIMNNEEDNIRVISYYGIGGIGKSTLLEHIKKDFLDKHDSRNSIKKKTCNIQSFFSDTTNLFMENNVEIPANNLSVYYDMGYSTDRVDILFKLKNKMIKECGFKFPRLEVLNRVFDYLRGENVKLSEIQDLIDENESYFKVGVEAIGEFPLIGWLFKILKTVKEINEIKVKSFKSKESINKFLIEKSKAPLAMEEELQEVFTYELNENLKDLKEPFVIMFDRFEVTMEKTDLPNNPKCKADWIYYEDGLIDNVPKVLWVIAGQKRLKWLDYDQESWKGILETNKVDALDNEFVVKILQNENLPGNLIAELAKETGGIPEYIRLCIMHAEYLKARNKTELTINDFRGDKNRDKRNKLADRFIEHLSDKERMLVNYLSVLDDWTDDMIEKMIPNLWKDYENYIYQRVKDLPFFEFKENGKYKMKKAIRDLIYTKFKAENPDFVEQILKETIKFYASNLSVNFSEGEL